MKQHTKHALQSLTVIFAAAALSACDVDKVEDGEMPEVEVKGDVKLPEYDVETADVKIGKKKVEMEVPTVDVEMPNEKPDENN